MQSMMKSFVFVAVTALTTVPVQAGETMQYFEQTTWFAFDDLGVPGRSVGDMMYWDAILIDQDSGQVEATKTGICTTYSQLPNGDFVGDCYETITFNDGSTLETHGSNFNQVAFERFEPQNLVITGGTGRFVHKFGNENIVQVRFPDQAFVTLVLYN